MYLPKIDRIKKLVVNNKKVVENYFFMTLLQVLNSLFYFIIYRYLMRTLGIDSYGVYAYSLAIVIFFVIFVTFGLDMPGVKSIAKNRDNDEVKSNTLSGIFTTKIYLLFIASLIYPVIISLIPNLKEYKLVAFILFSQTLTNIFFPNWFFQGIQKMKIVTCIQVIFKFASLPFIFLTIHSPSDLWIYAVITSGASVLGGFTATLIIRFQFKLKIRLMPLQEVKVWIKEGFPFLLSSSTSIIKLESVKIIAGLFIGMGAVTIYDLANKIIILIRTILMSVNGALFPKIIVDLRAGLIKNIIKIEALIGILSIIFTALVGKYIVLFFGGAQLLEAYPLSIILSITIFTWLVVGAINDFVFISQNKYYFVTKNQFGAFISYFIVTFIGLLLSKTLYALVIALAVSGLLEIVYCTYLIKKHKLL